MSELKRITFSA